MNHKSNKIFTKSCATILAASSIFSGVSAEGKPKEKNTKSGSISVTKQEFATSILGTSILSIFMTWLLSKTFSAQSTPAVAEKDNNSAPSKNSNETNHFSNSSDTSSISAPPRVDAEQDSQAVDSIILALNETDKMQYSNIHEDITKDKIFAQLNLHSDSEFLNYLAIDQKRVTLSNGAVYEYCIASTENPSCISGQRGNLGAKLQRCLQHLRDNCSAGDVFVMQLVNMTGHVAHSTCTVFNASKCKESKSGFESIARMNDMQSVFELSKYSDTPSFPLCSGNSSSMLLTVGCWKCISTPEPMPSEASSLETFSSVSEGTPLYEGTY